uniref:Uncharacterized protein n=1 Tax=Setaria italica TaxID=4555 RepID=K4APE3_SETIT
MRVEKFAVPIFCCLVIFLCRQDTRELECTWKSWRWRQATRRRYVLRQ